MEVWPAMGQRMRLSGVPAHARWAEALGSTGLNVPDAVHDGLLVAQAAYWPSLDLYGWGDVGRELRAMIREGRWKDLLGRISDEMLEVRVPCGTYDEIADILRARLAGVATRITFPIPEDVVWDARVAEVIAALCGRDR